MKAKIRLPMVALEPESPEEIEALRNTSWVLSKKGSFYAYWTYVALIHKKFPLTLSDEDRATLRAQRQFDPSLRNMVTKDLQALADRVKSYFAPDYQPRPYQIIGMLAMMRQRKVILADETGLGKTIQAIGAAVIGSVFDAKLGKDVKGTIVIVCQAGLRHQWRQEIMRMFRDPMNPSEPLLTDDEILLLDGPPALRNAMLKQTQRPVMIVNYELLMRDYASITAHLKRSGIYSLIFDESSRFKSRSSQTFKSVRSLVKDFSPHRLFCLNATPVENGLDDLWGQLTIVEPTIFPYVGHFESRYVKRIMIRTRTGMMIPKVTGYRHVDEVQYLMRDRYIRRTFAEVGEQLPDVLVVTREVKLGAEQREAYDAIASGPYENELGAVTQLSIAALYTKDMRGKITSAKLDVLPDLVEEIGSEKVVLVSESKRFCHLVVDVLHKHGKVALIDGDTSDTVRSTIVNEFTNGATQYLVGTSAIERGLNLQRASWLINLDLPWNPAKWKQRVGRLRRLASKHSCIRVINLLASDTIDEHVRRVIYAKDSLFTQLFQGDAVKLDEPTTLRSILGAAHVKTS